MQRMLALVVILVLGQSAMNSQTPEAQKKSTKLDTIDGGRVHAMLREVYTSIKKSYYDPTFHGIDLDARYHEYDARLNAVSNLGEAFRVIAAFLSGFHDSHLFFMPPGRAVSFDSGYRMQMVGDKCMVTQVRPATDAAQKVHPGDQLLQFNGFNLGRSDLHEVEYFFHVLSPASSEKLHVLAPDASAFDVTVRNTVRPLKRSLDAGNQSDIGDMMLRQEDAEDLTRERTVTTEGTFFWKMAQFSASESELNGIFERASKYPNLILDLRGNPGGYIVTLQLALGHLFDHDVKISERVGRKTSKPQVAKGSRNPYRGKVIVLIDSKSASSSELFARVVQLEHRGTVLGDTSAGAVMEARDTVIEAGTDSVIAYAYSITDANLLMADGKSLEGEGVHPDEVVLPTAQDLALGRDPVLARAAELAASKLDAASAAKLFPFEWQKL